MKKLLLVISFLVFQSINIVYAQCDHVDCATCDFEGDSDGTTHVIPRCPPGLACDFARRPCGTWVNPPWIQFFFVATSNTITIDIVDIDCPLPCDGINGFLIAYPSGNCIDERPICDFDDFTLESTDLIIGTYYELFIEDCHNCECEFTIEVDHPKDQYELYTHIAAYDECKEECLTGNCGNGPACGNMNEISIWAGETLEFFPLDNECDFMPESDIDIVWEINGVQYYYNLLFDRIGPILETDPEEEQVFEICITQFTAICGT